MRTSTPGRQNDKPATNARDQNRHRGRGSSSEGAVVAKASQEYGGILSNAAEIKQQPDEGDRVHRKRRCDQRLTGDVPNQHDMLTGSRSPTARLTPGAAKITPARTWTGSENRDGFAARTLRSIPAAAVLRVRLDTSRRGCSQGEFSEHWAARDYSTASRSIKKDMRLSAALCSETLWRAPKMRGVNC